MNTDNFTVDEQDPPKEFVQACDVLGLLAEEDQWTETDLKKQYRRLALMYHPDKNRANDANKTFHEVQNAYEFLMKYQGFSDDDADDEHASEPDAWTSSTTTHYETILRSFLNPILKSELFQEITGKIVYTILQCISDKCEEKAIRLLEGVDKRIFGKICELLKMYKEVFHFSDGFLERIEKAYMDKIQDDECVVLSPFLDDLFSDHVYKLVEKGQTYFIPLWHHELVYDMSGADLYVRCNPILPDDVEIDEKNNIHVRKTYSIVDLWSKKEIVIQLGKHYFIVQRERFKMCSEQTVVLYGQGVSRINTHAIYDVSKKSDIFVHVTIV